MSLTEAVVEGTLKPDGTLELDQKPSVSPGRVTVVVRPQSEAKVSSQSWWAFMQDARRQMEHAGCEFMTEAEVTAHIESLRADDRIDELLNEEAAR